MEWGLRNSAKGLVWTVPSLRQATTRTVLHTYIEQHHVCTLNKKDCAQFSQQENGIHLLLPKTIVIKGCLIWFLCWCFLDRFWMLLLLTGRIQDFLQCHHLWHPVVTKNHQKHGNPHQNLGEFDRKEITPPPDSVYTSRYRFSARSGVYASDNLWFMRSILNFAYDSLLWMLSLYIAHIIYSIPCFYCPIFISLLAAYGYFPFADLVFTQKNKNHRYNLYKFEKKTFTNSITTTELLGFST